MKRKKAKSESNFSPMMLLSSKSPFSVQEAYKTLRTNVTFSLPGTDCKCIGITSANRGEGKSTVAVNLSISLAQLDKKVLLIDCDMRLPTVITKFGVKAQEGLSDYLSGTIEEVPIIRIESKGVDIVPSGTIPPDSTALIDSQVMRDMVAAFKDMYDYVIFDFPPINIVTDAVLLTEMIDGYLLVVRHEFSEYQKIGEMLRQMQFADARIIGFVYNSRSEEKKYYKRRYYRYSYYKDGYYKKSGY